MTFNVAALCFLGLVARQLWLDPSFPGAAQGTLGFAAAAFCGLLGNIQHFESLQASISGFSAKMREAEQVIEDAKATVTSLHKLATMVGSFLVDAQEGSGRLQGHLTRIHKHETKARLVEQLKGLALPEDDLDQILRADQFWLSIDYMIALLHPAGPTDKSKIWAEEFQKVLSGNAPLTPDQCEEFMNKHNIDDADRRKLLNSYRHYVLTNQHVDPSLLD